MPRRLVCTAALALLVLVPVARADGPQASPGLIQGWTGVTAPGLPFRYVTMPAARSTVLAQVRRSSGRVWGFRTIAGIWGVPQVANDGTAGGPLGLHALPAARRPSVRARARRPFADGGVRRHPVARHTGHSLVSPPASRPACSAAPARDSPRPCALRDRHADVLGLAAGRRRAPRLPR